MIFNGQKWKADAKWWWLFEIKAESNTFVGKYTFVFKSAKFGQIPRITGHKTMSSELEKN